MEPPVTLEVDARVRVPGFELDVQLTAPPGITVLFGPTASGKTLTLRLIAGLEAASSGTVRFDGATFDARVPPQARGIGYAPQHGALWPHKTALEHVTAVAPHAKGILEKVDLAQHAGRKPAHLSGGERQRLAFARAIARDPKLLLLDEPFSALDDDARVAMGKLVRAHAQRGNTVIFVTHDREEAKRLADATVVYANGRARIA
jgi:ABC-type sulfate/molybdate transport systems ATPase subunit